MSYGNKQRYPIADPLPRFIPFRVASYNPGTTNNPPPVYNYTLPFQVKPNGKILCCELLEAEINWAPIVPSGATLYTENAGLVFRRLAFDADSDVVDGQAYQNAWGSASSPDIGLNPFAKPSVVGVVDNAIAFAGPSDTVAVGVAGAGGWCTQMKDLNVRYKFGCSGAYPVIPSSQLKIWSFLLNYGTAVGLESTDQYIPSTPALASPYNQVNISPDLVPVAIANATWAPVVTGRIWFRIVEITPMQHLLLCARYTSKDPNPATQVNKYNVTTVTGSETGTLDYNVVSQNPNPTAPLNPFFG